LAFFLKTEIWQSKTPNKTLFFQFLKYVTNWRKFAMKKNWVGVKIFCLPAKNQPTWKAF
jgi:hypothetical protein